MNEHSGRAHRRHVLLAAAACLTGLAAAPIVLYGLWLAVTVAP